MEWVDLTEEFASHLLSTDTLLSPESLAEPPFTGIAPRREVGADDITSVAAREGEHPSVD